MIYINNNNKFNIDIIGFNYIVPTEFKELFQINYIKMFELLVEQPISDFCDIMKWQFPNIFSENQIDIFKLE